MTKNVPKKRSLRNFGLRNFVCPLQTRRQVSTGTSAIVRGTAVFDRLYAYEECFSAVHFLTSTIKSDHRAIVAVSWGVVRSSAKTRMRIEVMRRSPDQHATLLRAFSHADLSGLTGITEPQEAWDHFYAECHKRLREFYPKRKVTMTSADPPYFTPGLKLLLRRKNRLMRAGRLDEASTYQSGLRPTTYDSMQKSQES